MKRRVPASGDLVRGFYVSSAAEGFMGSGGEGGLMLRKMGLPDGAVPFSVALFLQSGRAKWRDRQGNAAFVSFALKGGSILCSGSYMGRSKSLKLVREWGEREDPEMVARLESGAIGDLCMRCILEKMD